MTFEKPSTWCAAFFGIIFTTLVVVACVDYTIDFYGIFHSSRHAPVRLYSNERMGKYLLGMQYIPENFTGILIGSSISENWPLIRVGSTRIYNASLSGGNISEEKLIAENVFARGHITLAVFCIYPYLTASHGLKSSYMTSQDYWGALGSIPLFREYLGAALARRGRAPVLVNEYGISDAHPEAEGAVVALRRQAGLTAGARPAIAVDPTALAEYVALLQAARAKGATIFGFIPPMYVPANEGRAEELRAYFARMATLFRSDEKIVDFNVPAYASYTTDRAKFVDNVHLTSDAAAFFASELEETIQRELALRAERAARN